MITHKDGYVEQLKFDLWRKDPENLEQANWEIGVGYHYL